MASWNYSEEVTIPTLQAANTYTPSLLTLVHKNPRPMDGGDAGLLVCGMGPVSLRTLDKKNLSPIVLKMTVARMISRDENPCRQ
jgi:hypothetical protein